MKAFVWGQNHSRSLPCHIVPLGRKNVIKKGAKNIKGKIGSAVAKTLFFNMAATLFTFYLVLKKKSLEDFFDVFTISFITGLFSYTFAKIAVNFTSEKPNRQDFILLAPWLFTGPGIGSFLSCFFYYFSTGNNEVHMLKTVFLYAFVFGMIFEGGFFYYFYSRQKIKASEKIIHDERIKRLTMEKETAITTMKLLQAQIEPHFLFNTHSNIIALIDTDLKKAQKMLMDLNAYLRISLRRTRQAMITLDQELALISRYLDIFKVRMGKRLIYQIEKTGDCAQISFPPMIIQPLVENAIKYGLEPKKDGGCIKIECRADQTYLKITVSDTGLGPNNMHATMGIGLDNISRRLENIYGDRAMLTIKKNKPSGVKAIVEVTL